VFSWRQVTRGFRGLTSRAAVEAELDEEVRDFYVRAHEDLVRQGLTADEAARVARRQLGDAAKARETLRSYGWENVVETVLADVRQSGRRLRNAPGFALIAVLTLALGIGTSTAIFSAVVPILFEPLPYPDADRLAMLTDRTPEGAPLDTTYGTYTEVTTRSRSFEALAVADRWAPALAGDGESERLSGDRVSATYFRVLGVAPAIGRDFESSDETVGGETVAIVSDALAKRRFGSAEAVLDATIRLDGLSYTVIGVMPAGFRNVLAPAADVWSPLQYRAQAPFESGEWGHHLRMTGRLRPGVSHEQAEREIAALGSTPLAEFPRPEWASLENGLVVESLQRSVTAAARPALLAIMGAVMLLLGIACANVTNLIVARSVGRRGELAVRAALGAGRCRLVRQLLTESLLLALVGGALGLGLAFAGLGTIIAIAPAGLPRVDAIGFDVSAFLFAFTITALVGLFVGLAPALRGARSQLGIDLHAGSFRMATGSQHVLSRGLVIAQIALALVLLTATGLLLRSIEQLLSTAPGFNASNLLSMQVVASDYRFSSKEETLVFFQSALEAVRAVPGVSEAAFSSQLPLSEDYDAYGARFESTTEAYQAQGDGAFRYVVTPGWFRTMGIPLLRGRLLDARDRPGAPPAVLLSESFAKRRFGDRDAIGERLRIGPEDLMPDRPWSVVVGVVGDVKQASLGLAPPDAFYEAMGQWPWVDTVQSLVARTVGDPGAYVTAIKTAIWSVDSAPPIDRIATMEDLLVATEAERSFVLRVFAIFAVAALVLAALGLYGVIAGSVAERTREIGLRSALGATRMSILSLVVRQGMTLVALGVALGLVGAVAASRALEALLFEIAPLDPLTYTCVIVLLTLVAAAACWAPAWRASRVDPTIALRTE
jgi:putative ABC transport system permease protein